MGLITIEISIVWITRFVFQSYGRIEINNSIRMTRLLTAYDNTDEDLVESPNPSSL